jgi:branched-chain amino acid transport system substrate-binding protein
MHLKQLVVGVAVAGGIAGGSALATQALAQDGTFIPLLTYRTGPFANSGIPIANGMHDYFTMLNERDGGIGGSKIVLEECETGYKNERGQSVFDRHHAGADP